VGIFRRHIHSYYVKRLKLPPTEAVVPGVSVLGVPRNHPKYNLILRDSTFRLVDWIYYDPDRHIVVAVFTPGITNVISKVHPSRNIRLRDSTFRPPFLDYYQPRRLIYPSEFVPGITTVVSKVHPSRNMRLRDNTFRPPFLNYYQLQRAVTIAEIEAALSEILFKKMWHRMYKKMR
jgi:hypothetical protein